jgi:hypothetical protein
MILVTRMMEAIPSSDTPALTRATRRNIPEDAFFFLHRHVPSWEPIICGAARHIPEGSPAETPVQHYTAAIARYSLLGYKA